MKPLQSRDQFALLLYLVVACLTLTHSVYYSYSSMYVEVHSQHPGPLLETYYQQHNSTAFDREHPLFNGTDHAPNQYRVAVPYLARALGSSFRITKLYILYSMFDFVCALCACWVLYRLLNRSTFIETLGETERLSVSVLMLASISYPFAWISSFQRPETLPTALYLALVCLVISRSRAPALLGFAGLLTLWQSFVRSDVPAMFGLVILLFSWMPAAKKLFGSAMRAALFGALNLALALSIQFLLQHVLFPHASYPPDTPLLQWIANFQPRRLATFCTAILPYSVIVASAVRCWRRLDPLDHFLILASLTYLPLWLLVGVASEVRIFVPYLLVLTPTAAKVLWLTLRGDFAAAETGRAAVV